MEEQVPHEITTPDGHVYRLKQPLYKQPLFWTTIISCVMLFCITFMVAGLSIVNLAFLGHGTRTEIYQDNYKHHRLGDSVRFENGLKVTVQYIHVDSKERMEGQATGAMITAKVIIENTSSEKLPLNVYDFDLQDEMGESYVMDDAIFEANKIKEELVAGEKVEWKLMYDGEDGSQQPYTLAYDNVRWGETKSVKF